MSRAGRNRYDKDKTVTIDGVGEVRGISFQRRNVGTILQQALSHIWDRGNNQPILLPRKFQVMTFRPDSCDVIQRSDIPVELEHTYKEIYRDSISTPGWRAQREPKFFLSHDEKYCMKILRPRACKVFRHILPQLSEHIAEHQYTFLPRIFGLYCYKGHGKKKFFVVMNNILPSTVFIDEIYDLKGVANRRGDRVIGKDSEFRRKHPRGLTMNQGFSNSLEALLVSDCKLLKEMGLTSYSLLVGIHQVAHDQTNQPMSVWIGNMTNFAIPLHLLGKLRLFSSLDPNLTFGIQFNALGIPGYSVSGPVLIYIGIVDIQRRFYMCRAIKYFFKSAFANQTSLSALPPDDYKHRFTTCARTWFR